jgi:hypothetical protein
VRIVTARILRIELRRSIALFAAVLIAAGGVFVLYASNPPYRSWMELVTVQRDIMQVLWPLALGLGAWQARRERRSRMDELLATTPRPRWLRVQPMLTAMALAAVIGYLVMFAGGSGHVRHPDGYFPTGAVPVLAIGALSLADHDLDRSAVIAWPPRRAAHVIVAGAAVAGLLIATAVGGRPMAGAATIARDVVGLSGLVALGATGLGAAQASLLPVVWTVPVLWFAPPMGIPPTRPTYKVLLTWMVQPPGTTAATVAALVLGGAGIFAYALFGSRR